MIRKCGILRRSHVKQYREANALYRNEDHPDDAGPKRFRDEHSVCGADDIPVQCVGVWDTVGSLGFRSGDSDHSRAESSSFTTRS